MAEDITTPVTEPIQPTDEEKQLAIDLLRTNLKKANLECDKLEAEKEKILAEKEKIKFDKSEVERISRIHGLRKTANWETGLKIAGGIALITTLFLLIYKPYSELREAQLTSDINIKKDSLTSLSKSLASLSNTLKAETLLLESVKGQRASYADSLNNTKAYLSATKSDLDKEKREGRNLKITNRIVLSKLEQAKDSLRIGILDSERKLYDLGSLQQEASDEQRNAIRERRHNRLDEGFKNAQRISLLRLDSVCLLQRICLRESKKTEEDILKCIEPIFKVYGLAYTDFYSLNKDIYDPNAELAIAEAKKELKPI